MSAHADIASTGKNFYDSQIFEVRTLDKFEYNLKLDEMKSLYADGEYEAAADIADSINWNKIKNVNTLVKAGEVYEKMERYQEGKELLMMAYDRSPIGRNIIFRLAEVSIKMKDFDSAVEYYNEFVEIAPHDNLRYVIQYNMKKAQGSDYKELISILEEFKDVEYTEEWAYELAYLYHKAELSEQCVDACDELILWFGDGPYVERALELKMLYQPLTKTQEEKYRRFRMEKQDVITIGAEEMKRAGEYVHETVEIPKVEVNSRFNTVNLQAEIAKGMQQILEATEKETVSDTMDNIKRIVEEIPYLQIPKDEEAEELAEQVQIEEDINNTLKMNFKELLDEESDGQMSIVTGDERMIEKQITGQLSIDEVLSEWEKTKRAAEVALQQAEQQKLESAKARALHEAEDIMDRLNDVIPKLDAGISPKALLEQEYMSAAVPELPKIKPVFVGGANAAHTEEGYPVDMPEEISEEMSEREERAFLDELVREPLPEVLSLDDEEAEFDDDSSMPEDEWQPQAAAGVAQAAEEELQRSGVAGVSEEERQWSESAGAAKESQRPEVDGEAEEELQWSESAGVAEESQQSEAVTDAAKGSQQSEAVGEAEEELPWPEEVGVAEEELQWSESAGAAGGVEKESQRQKVATGFAEDSRQLKEATAIGEDSAAKRSPAIGIEIPEEDSKEESLMEPEKLFDHMNQMLGRHIRQINNENEMIDAKIAQAAGAAIGSAEESVGEVIAGAAGAAAESIKDIAGTADSGIIGDAEDIASIVAAAKAEAVKKADSIAAASNTDEPEVAKEPSEELPEQEPAKEEPSGEDAQDMDTALGTGPMQRMKTKPIPTIKDFKKQWSGAREKKSETSLPKDLDTWKKDLEPELEEQHHLTDAQKAVFSYFVPVSGMENQLAKALENISAHLKKKEPAYTSNLVIQGGQGCGKTVLATSMVKALQNETGKPNNHIGKIDAYTLNKKDIQLLLRKVQGGCLIIESAGDMSKQAAVTLSLLLEQDDSGLLVILEDTSKGIKKALAQDDAFAKKFTEKISVPVFTNDDLVAFANSYSKELGYKIDDMAILALYNRISNIQRLDQATTLAEIKDIVDEAIDREARVGLHKYFSILTAKRYTDDDRIILQEKDFN